MYIAVSLIILALCILLGLVILVQNPKGGGLNASLGSVSNQVFGAKKSTNLVEKVTWILAGVIMFLSLGSAIFIDNGNDEEIKKTEAEKANEEGLIDAIDYSDFE